MGGDMSKQKQQRHFVIQSDESFQALTDAEKSIYQLELWIDRLETLKRILSCKQQIDILRDQGRLIAMTKEAQGVNRANPMHYFYPACFLTLLQGKRGKPCIGGLRIDLSFEWLNAPEMLNQLQAMDRHEEAAAIEEWFQMCEEGIKKLSQEDEIWPAF